MNTNELLAERANTHGDFSEVAHTAQGLKKLVSENSHSLTETQQEAIDMIASKLGRICSGNPCEPDHWRDIAGYATLVANELEQKGDMQ